MSSDLFALQRKHPRPKSLSDPYDDNTPQRLREILRKSDADLAWADFKTLLGPHLPAGTYEEVAYFLPLAFEFIRTHKADALDLCSTLVGFCAQNHAELESDGARDAARSRLLGLLREWTSRFQITHFDKFMCERKGWKLQYFDHVEMSETVCETLSDLVQFSQDADLAETLVSEVIAFGDDTTKAAWLLELVRARDDVYHPPVIARLEQAANELPLLRDAYRVVQGNDQIRENSRTYWRDTVSKLGIK